MGNSLMSYSAHYSAPGAYAIPANFYAGAANALEIPVIGGLGGAGEQR